MPKRRPSFDLYRAYVQKYRENDVFYHITTRDDALSLCRHGFDPSRVGSRGGCQSGIGLCCTWTRMDAWDWGQKLYGWNSEPSLALVTVHLPGITLATHEYAYDAAHAATLWGQEHGYLALDAAGRMHSLQPLTTLCHGTLADPGWVIIGLYLRHLGYDGYMIGMDELVVMNFDLLRPHAFSLLP